MTQTTATHVGTARKVFKVLGTTDEVTECQHCGRVDLKGTIILGELDADGNVSGTTYFGAVCGARAAEWTTREIRKAAAAVDRAAVEAARIERARLADIEHARVRALDGTAECYLVPQLCRRQRRNCVAHS
ncbi:MAG: hypothetical protein ACRDRY_25255 [Pseudonocardiaceae bacterium]